LLHFTQGILLGITMPLIRRLIKGVGAGIGAASEAIADHKEKKAAKERELADPTTQSSEGLAPGSGTHPSTHRSYSTEKKHHDDDDTDSIDSSDLDDTRAQWALDEVAEDLAAPPPGYEEATSSTPASEQDVTRAFLANHKLTVTPSLSFKQLPLPVIIPQRRPKDKSRGFVRAYAPILGECSGIDQTTFIDFLNDLDIASKSSPIFDVINMASFAVGLVPNPIAMAVSIVVTTVNRTAQEIQSRTRRNHFLEEINEHLFKPRGLYCLIMTYKPDMPHDPLLGMNVISAGTLNSTDQALVKATSIPDSEFRNKLRGMRLASGTTQGEMALPESAPLIYPALDAAAQAAIDAQGGASGATRKVLPNGTKAKIDSSGGFLASYLDRRAQANYQGMNPNSRLVMPPPEKKFASRYSDPNHPANSGTLLGLLTGGHFDPTAKKRGRRAQRRAWRRGYQLTPQEIQDAEMGRRDVTRRQGIIKKVLQKNVLYLTVVNLPSESEMKEILGELDRIKSQQSYR
jgi:hypothetical protein